jgi:hypothetical protein
VTGDLKKQTEAIREMIDYRLKSMSAESAALPAESHLDEDTISAFVEGRLAASESRPVLSHLTACRSCRQASAQLLRLENEVLSNQKGRAGCRPFSTASNHWVHRPMK